MTSADLLAKLRELKHELVTLYKVREIGLFGSFVREEQDGQSDIDLLVEFDFLTKYVNVIKEFPGERGLG